MHGDLWTLLAPLVAPETLVWAEQVGASPTPPPKPYVELDVSNGGVAPYLMPLEPDEQGRQRWIEHAVATVQATFYGQHAMDRAKEFGMRLRVPSTTDRATALNVGIQMVEGATDIPFRNAAGQYEDRSMVEFTAQLSHELVETPGLLEHVELGCPDPFTGAPHLHRVSAPGRTWPNP